MTGRAAAADKARSIEATRGEATRNAEESAAPGSTSASARSAEEMRCTLCGLRACWTES